MAIRYLSGINVDSNTLFVDSTNNRVGIGTGSPSYSLDVNTASNSDALRVQRAGAARFILNGDGVMTWGSSAGNGVLTWDSNIAYVGGQTNNSLGLFAGGSEKVRITTGGNLLIGTTTDAGYKLDVSGTGRFSGQLSVTGSTNEQLILDYSTASGGFTWQSFRLNGTNKYRLFGYVDNSFGIYSDILSAQVFTIASSGAATFSSSVTASSLIKSGGTSSQYLMADGSVSTLTNPVTGTGTTNYVPKFTGASAIGNSVIYENGGNIGIGITNADYPLTVSSINVGDAGANLGIVINGLINTAIPSSSVKAIIGVTNSGFGYSAGSLLIQPRTGVNGVVAVATEGTEKLRITHEGNVGIGTTSPNVTLETNGKVRSTRSGVASQYLEIDGGTSGAVYLTAAGASKPLVIQNNNTTQSDIWFDQAVASPYLWLQGGVEKMRITSIGRLGIGTTNPATKLHVVNASDVAIIGDGNDNYFGNYTSGDYFDIGNLGSTGNVFLEGRGVSTNINSQYRSKGAGSHIWTYNGGANEIMRTTSAGNLLIGTTTDAGYKLDVNGGGRYYSSTNGNFVSLTLSNTSVGSGARNTLQFTNDTGNVGSIDVFGSNWAATGGGDDVADGFRVLAPGSGGLSLRSSTSTIRLYTGSSERMRITSAGNVGIGTTSPAVVSGYVAETIDGTNGSFTEYRQNGTALFRIGADGSRPFLYGMTSAHMDFFTNTAQRMRITNDGNILLGTNQSYTRLTVSNGNSTRTGVTLSDADTSSLMLFAGASTIASINFDTFGLRFMGGSTAGVDNGTEIMRFTTSYNVGIGTSSPYEKLEVSGAISATGATNSTSAQGHSTTISVNGGNSYLEAVDWGAEFKPLIVNANYIVLQTGTGSTSARMTIANNGNVGIGTTSPGSKLSISGSNTGSVPLVDLVASGSGAFQRGVRMLNSGMAAGDSIMYAAGRSDNSKNMGQFYFYYAGDGSNSNRISMGLHSVDDVFNITGAGNVGIGTTSPSQALHVSGNIRVTGAYYDSNNSAGTSGQVLSSTGSGTAWVNQGEATATSLYDLLPAARVSLNWTGQVVNDTWTTVFSKSSNLLTTGTWMVKMYVSDFATGGGHYTYTYSGMFTWYQDTTNQGGESAASEIYLHRMGHAANASVLYLRTTETSAASSGDGLFQIKGNYSNTSNQTIQFQFVKIF